MTRRNVRKQGWVFPLFSPDSDDRLSLNFHRFVILCCGTRSVGLGQYCVPKGSNGCKQTFSRDNMPKRFGIHKVRILVLIEYQTCPVPLSTRNNLINKTCCLVSTSPTLAIRKLNPKIDVSTLSCQPETVFFNFLLFLLFFLSLQVCKERITTPEVFFKELL